MVRWAFQFTPNSYKILRTQWVREVIIYIIIMSAKAFELPAACSPTCTTNLMYLHRCLSTDCPALWPSGGLILSNQYLRRSGTFHFIDYLYMTKLSSVHFSEQSLESLVLTLYVNNCPWNKPSSKRNCNTNWNKLLISRRLLRVKRAVVAVSQSNCQTPEVSIVHIHL